MVLKTLLCPGFQKIIIGIYIFFLQKKVNQCEQRTNKLLQTLEGYKKKKKDTETKKKELEAELKVAKEACEKEKERATNFQPRFETTRYSIRVETPYKLFL